MAIKVKDISVSSAKYVQNAQGASSEYAQNAAAAGSEWEQNTRAAASNYKQAVSAGNIQERFARGVAAAGSEKYTRMITAKGANRYGSGVAEAQQDWASGFGPYAQTLAGLTLPARQPRGSKANIARVSAVADALNAKRLSLLGG